MYCRKQPEDIDELYTVDTKSTDKSEHNSDLESEKIIITIDILLETTKFDNTNEELNKLTKKHNAYIENSSISYSPYHGSKNYRNAFYTIRIPKDNVHSFKTDLNKSGNIIRGNCIINFLIWKKGYI
ncbi:MAG TPA: DUF4349 domain-containing protein [Tepidimicrobium sp.]|nr:DUF4349 domain-containing protein [Tepidimicrobium sp.]